MHRAHRPTDKPPLTGSLDVTLEEGKTVTCKITHTQVLKKLEDYDPKTVSEITGVPAKDIERKSGLPAGLSDALDL